ncbi:MAG: bifunctional tRNA (5-methylaminomethyl-2-thiouridine)(34)-methyltransferase MnmD/FAD-dependent 5-carboxymethylaminomethyl-2-thiouridine(34) oxidoreductase MnmC [Burkholderiales bacterium]|nr:bifunctional tRNA (5-methylaminomethyl-2-thiouridine)(34)-methyltransferase MnmD/FAD-dependent 5-carboxymethylaminomethyl-2-thiouridine(34) oxidoreductase MnmC [Burkholderiales bacterium]
MSAPIRPARAAFGPDGTPVSTLYGDVYHSAAGGEAQARHVFLAGTGLPERWRGRSRFTVLELGFGFGLSFLVTWRAWREDPARCARLHFVSVEKHPFPAADLAILHERYPALAALAKELRAAWPMLVPGFQRIEFEGGRVLLTLAFGDVAQVLPQIEARADAAFLDGFAPAKNPEMWSAEAMRGLARLCAPGSIAATWSVAARVKENLAAAGFSVEKRPGFARKHEMLVARPVRTRSAPPPEPSTRRALVVGAGVAGASVCERLARRGWDVVLVERHAKPAAEASGNPAGAFHPLLTPDDSLLARFTRAAFLHTRRAWKTHAGILWSGCGLLQLAEDAKDAESQARSLAALSPPDEYARRVSAEEASSLAGVRLRSGGLFYAQAGWVSPSSACTAWLSACGDRLETHFGVEVASLERSGGEWIARDRAGGAIAAAPVAVLANAAEGLRLAPQPHVPLRRVRGQATLIPPIPGLRLPVLRAGMVLPELDGRSLVGSTFDAEDDDPLPRAESNAANLARLERILPGAAAGLDPAALDACVGFRATVRDRLPLVGALCAADDSRCEVRTPGLYGAFAYGSRGYLWAALCAELLASILEGEPLPLEKRLAAAIDPGRFALRAARRQGGYQRSSRRSS